MAATAGGCRVTTSDRRGWADPLWWSLALLLALLVGMVHLAPLFAAALPALDRPVYVQDSFMALMLAHLGLVAASSAVSIGLGLAAGVTVTRPTGKAFRPLTESVVAMGQTFPPVAVLAIAVPVLGFGPTPALIALALYGLLPILQATISGLDAVPAEARDAATGLGMNTNQVLTKIELPLAWPVIVAGIRSSVLINIGTAAIASTVGVKTLGSPIIIGLAGFNTAYVIQGALLVGLLAVVTDLAFERWSPRLPG